MNGSFETNHELLEFFKALVDANRLRMIGVLALAPYTVEQIAVSLKLPSATVSHHLELLVKVGLVSTTTDSKNCVYKLETRHLEAMAQRILSQESQPHDAGESDLDVYDRKVLRAYLTPDGRVRDFPTQQKKLEVILRHVVRVFEPDQRYSERQVNELLVQFNDDTACLRRYLVDYGLLQRNSGGGEYWLP